MPDGIIIPDNTIDRLVAAAFRPLIKWRKNERKFPVRGDFSSALGLVSNAECTLASRVKSHDTTLGGCLQKFVSLIAQENDTLEVSAPEKPNRRVTDISILAHNITHLMFVQAQIGTKNGDGSRTIKDKMKQYPKGTARGVIAAVQGKASRKNVSENTVRLCGPALFQFLTSTDEGFTNGDDTLYTRILESLGRYGKKIR